MQSKNQPDIGLLLAEEFPDKIIEEFKNELNAPGLNFQVHKIPVGVPYSMWEWALPTVVTVFILKSYFDGFLKEAGKSHYNIFQNWLKKTSNNVRAIKVTTIAASQSTQKLSQTNTQSKVFSIETKTNNGQQLKFLFDDTLTKENWDSAIDKLLKLLDEHFTNGTTDELTIEIKQNSLEKTIYARLKNDKIDWEFLDYKKIAQEMREKQNK